MGALLSKYVLIKSTGDNFLTWYSLGFKWCPGRKDVVFVQRMDSLRTLRYKET